MCLGAIDWARLARLYFAATHDDAAAAGFDDALIYEQIAMSPEQRSIPTIRVNRLRGHSPNGRTRRTRLNTNVRPTYPCGPKTAATERER